MVYEKEMIRGPQETFGMINMFLTLIAEMVSGVDTNVKTIKLHTLHMCSLLYVNLLSIKVLKSQESKYLLLCSNFKRNESALCSTGP